MDTTSIRYQHNPLLTDTVGFFDCCIPLTNESSLIKVDSLQKFYDFSVYNYITPPPAPRQLLETTSVFAPHNLKPVSKGPQALNQHSMDWITMLLMVCLFIFAWVQASYAKRLKQIIRAAIQPYFINQLEREGSLFRERISLGLGFTFLLIVSVFVFLLFKTFGSLPPVFSPQVFLLLIFSVLLLFQVIRSAFIYFSGFIFNTREASRMYQLNTLLFNHIIGIVLLPLTIMAFYLDSKALLSIGVVITTLLILYGFFRNILTGLANKNYNLFYLFLYLCTLEILPMLLLYKVISKI